MENKKIYVTQSLLPAFDDYIEEIRDIWDSHMLTNKGEKHKELNERLIRYLGVNMGSLFVNGHLGLESVLESYKLEGEIITTPFTFPSTAHAIMRQGCKPVFCDIKADDYTMDESQIESLITDKTTAILPVHLFGHPCNVKKIEEIAKKHNLKVIYDAAHVFGVTIDGVGIGNFGDASMFSMNATKVFNTIEGGLITFNDPKLAEQLDLIKYYGIKKPDSIVYYGSNFVMNEFQAAMGLCNLPLVDAEIQKRKAVALRYLDLLGNIDSLILPDYKSNIRYNYSYFPVVFDHYKHSRDEIFTSLEEAGIYAKKYFYPLVTDYECYASEEFNRNLPIAKKIAENIICLPIYGELNFTDIDRIVAVILQD